MTQVLFFKPKVVTNFREQNVFIYSLIYNNNNSDDDDDDSFIHSFFHFSALINLFYDPLPTTFNTNFHSDSEPRLRLPIYGFLKSHGDPVNQLAGHANKLSQSWLKMKNGCTHCYHHQHLSQSSSSSFLDNPFPSTASRRSSTVWLSPGPGLGSWRWPPENDQFHLFITWGLLLP